jgi:competence protein ComEC
LTAETRNPGCVGSRSFSGSEGQRARQYAIAPLAPLVAATAAGIVVDRYVQPGGTQTWLTLAAVSGMIAVLAFRRPMLSSLAALLAFAGLAGGWHHNRWWDLAPNDLARSVTETPQPAWIRGVVREALGVRQNAGFGFGAGETERVTTRFVVDLTAISDGQRWTEASGRAMVVVEGDRSAIHAGQAVEAAGQIAKVAGPLNPGEFDYRGYLQSQGIRLRLTVDDPASLWRDPDGTDNRIAGWLGRLRTWSRARLVERLDSRIAPLAAALLLGQREGVDPEVNDAFARTGTTHLLAISGLQLQALALALLTVFRFACLPRRPAYLAVALITAAYALLVGLAPSVVRSTVMTLTFCLAAMAQRMTRPANTLAVAALATLGVNPVYLFDIGCQLSFLAIASLMWLVPLACARIRRAHALFRLRVFGPPSPLDELERTLDPWLRTALRKAGASLLDGVVASTVVWLAALPLVALKFHLVSPIGVILNIPLIPLTSAALLVGGLGLALTAIAGPLGDPCCWVAATFLGWTEAVVRWGVAQTWGYRFVVGPRWGWVLVFYGVLGAAVVSAYAARRDQTRLVNAFWRNSAWALLVAWIVPAWLLPGDGPQRGRLEAEVLAVGHGLAVVIQTPDDQTLLYDCGRLGDPSVGRRVIAPALWARGVNRIDTILLSHADQDHYDGLPDLLDRFRIGVVRVPPGFAGPTNPQAIKLIDRIRSCGVAVRTIAAPETWESGGARFAIWHPRAGWYPEAPDNARSLVLDVAAGGHHLLLTGDLEQPGLDELVALPSPKPGPDVLLAPHHGGKAANPEWFYRWARPRSVVVSQRPPPPSASDALSSLERQGISLARTWREGAIRLAWTDDAVKPHGFLTENLHQKETRYWTRLSDRIGPSRVVLRLGTGLLGFALGAIACAFLAVIEFGAWALVVPPRKRVNQSEPDPAPATLALEGGVEPITIRTPEGVRLACRWMSADESIATGRTVLLLHGFAELPVALERHRAAALIRHGWNVAALDSRGYGESDGPYGTFGMREADDVRLWLDVLAERLNRRDPLSPFRPVLWGRSMGSATALQAAAFDARIGAVVLESPFLDLDTVVAAVLRRRRLPFSSLLARMVTRRAGRLAGVSLCRPRPIDLAARVECPALIVHGTDDTLIPIDAARKLADAFPSPPYWLDVAGAGHTSVIDTGGAEVLDRIAAFLDEVVHRDEPMGIETPEK